MYCTTFSHSLQIFSQKHSNGIDIIKCCRSAFTQLPRRLSFASLSLYLSPRYFPFLVWPDFMYCSLICFKFNLRLLYTFSFLYDIFNSLLLPPTSHQATPPTRIPRHQLDLPWKPYLTYSQRYFNWMHLYPNKIARE